MESPDIKTLVPVCFSPRAEGCYAWILLPKILLIKFKFTLSLDRIYSSVWYFYSLETAHVTHPFLPIPRLFATFAFSPKMHSTQVISIHLARFKLKKSFKFNIGKFLPCRNISRTSPHPLPIPHQVIPSDCRLFCLSACAGAAAHLAWPIESLNHFLVVARPPVRLVLRWLVLHFFVLVCFVYRSYFLTEYMLIKWTH